MIAVSQQLEFLKKHFGFDSFRPNQEAIINDIINQQDVVAIMPTGGGKSLCFQLPAILLPGTAIVISPLIALMKDQVDALQTNGISAAFFNSSQTINHQHEVLRSLQSKQLKLLYIAPESLPNLLPYLNVENINLFAIDEAHCISSWGHDFRPAYTQLGQLKTKFPSIPVAAFTATADVATQSDIANQLKIPNAKKHLASFNRENLYLEVRPGTKRLPQIFSFLKNKRDQSGIIYCLSRKSTETLADKLNEKGFEAIAYHAGLDAFDRSRIQDDFVNDRTSIIVATIAFGMGIDKSNVRWVIHYNMPKNIEGYYQEIGRSGRDGLPAKTLLFYSFADVIKLRNFIEDAPNKAFQLAKLERMQQFSEALSCRRIALLNYFGENLTQNCGNCDNCKSPPQFFDGTILAQKICSAVYRLKEQESIGMLVDVLRGSKNAKVYDKGYQLIKTFGIVKDIAWLDLQQYIIQLVNQGVLEIHFHENGRIALTPFAKKILFKNKSVKLATLQQVKKTTQTEKIVNYKPTGLFELLRGLRKDIAIKENVPAYIVFSDAALKDMEMRLPKTTEEFMEINGVGEVKLERYGNQFLQLIAEFVEQKQNKKPNLNKNTTQYQTLELLEQGLSVKEIATQRELNENTIYGHLQHLHEDGELVSLKQFISSEEIQQIMQAKALAPQETDEIRLKPIFDYLNEQLPYWKIRMGLYLGENKSRKD